MHYKLTHCFRCFFMSCAALAGGGVAASAAEHTVPTFLVLDLPLDGLDYKATDNPVRDVELQATFKHEDSGEEITVWGFYNGDGKGGAAGNQFAVRFTPTRVGAWTIADVRSNDERLDGQREGETINAIESKKSGFWIVDPESPGGRWFQRSDGKHRYVLGNTHYSFLSGIKADGEPNERSIEQDVADNSLHFSKLRFSVGADRYPNPDAKPFLDNEGKPSDKGKFSHRPNPDWWENRVDPAIAQALQNELIMDMILAGPDTQDTRSTLLAEGNEADPTPYLRYIAARYGSFPNVWITLANEFNIKKPSYTPEQIADYGMILQEHLAYPIPVSVHASSGVKWHYKFDELPEWSTHQVIQSKLRDLSDSADAVSAVWRGRDGDHRTRPTVNDELSYQGEGDGHRELDSVEAALGAFVGGGYATVGHKTAGKKGQYFEGGYDPEEHSAIDNLHYLRRIIDQTITFWKMAPDTSIFENLDPGFRGMAWEGKEYVLATDKAHTGMVANLPEGEWLIRMHDFTVPESQVVEAEFPGGEFSFNAPASRAVLFHFDDKRRHPEEER